MALESAKKSDPSSGTHPDGIAVVGPMKSVGNAIVTAIVTGDVAAVKAAIDAGAGAARQYGEVLAAQVIARPHDDLATVLPKSPAAAKH